VDQGIITKVEISKDASVRTLTIDIRENDPSTVDLFVSDGVDYNPQVGDTVHFDDMTKEFQVVSRAVSTTGPDSDLAPGERQTFASDGNSRQATITQRADGTIELAGKTDHAVLYSELKTAFDQLVDWCTQHTHPVSGAATTAPSISATADMTAAKASKVKL
jgi:hypothetical protein